MTTSATVTQLRTKNAAEKGQDAREKAEKAVHEELVQWRLEEWEKNWMDWPMYGPDWLIGNEDLLELSKEADDITSLEQLWTKTHIPHWDELSQPLLIAIGNAAQKHLQSVLPG